MKKTIINLPENTDLFSVKVNVKDGVIEILHEEKEEKYVPKFGDIVKVISNEYGVMRNYMICIMPDKELPKIQTNGFFNIANIGTEANIVYNCGYMPTQQIVPASESEKAELFEKLAEEGYQWNEKKKKIERWRAKSFKYYFIINTFMNIEEVTECNTSADEDLWESGNYFRTREEAEKYCEKIKNILKR